MCLNLGPELQNGLFHLLAVPVCSSSIQSVAVLLGVSLGLYSLKPEWAAIRPAVRCARAGSELSTVERVVG